MKNNSEKETGHEESLEQRIEALEELTAHISDHKAKVLALQNSIAESRRMARVIIMQITVCSEVARNYPDLPAKQIGLALEKHLDWWDMKKSISISEWSRIIGDL